MYCRDCRYPLRDLDVHRCPECGSAFDPNDPDTFDRSLPNSRWLIGLAVIGGILLLVITARMVNYVRSFAPDTDWTFWHLAWVVFFLTVVQWVPLMLAVIAAGWLLRVILARFSRANV